jgi:ATP-dependent RNA helicase RhlE
MTAPLNTKCTKTFDELGIAPKLLEILTRQKFITPTPIQEQSIPSAIAGKDLMGIAQTGTGKTLAFGIPMIQRILQTQGKIMGLVILPTRELALQVDQTLKKIGESIGLKTAILIGGENPAKQHRALNLRPQIIIATPGRINDFIEHSRLNLSRVGILVLDEADRMLDMGFAPQIKKILQSVPKQRQTMLFSATMPQEIVGLAKSYMTLPLRVEVAPAGTSVKSVTQEIFFVDNRDKISLLTNILAQYTGSILVFTRTKFGAKKITHKIRALGYTANEIHSNRSLGQRVEALEGFKIGRYRILVATDIAARGIDVTGIQLVLNYDLPDNPEDYVHRIGRTARAGRAGHAISFATPDQRGNIRGIERLIRINLPVSPTPALPEIERLPMTPGFKPNFNPKPRPNQNNYRLGRPGQDNRNKNRPSWQKRGRSRPNRSSRQRQRTGI